mgnify:CR=1 FL=1|tara:strand:- start:3555 stop:4244 length:690 start_codon:yes stop_codon:yes gene_type:complete
MANTEIDIDIIQKQIQNCEDIVNNIDTIVPKLYKIRQQALSQRNYISDVNDKIFKTMTGVQTGSDKIITFQTDITHNFDSIINSTNLTGFDGTITATSENSRKIIQSLFKFKHELGTSAHFTTEQFGIANDRIHGLNLRDVISITNSLKILLSASNSTPTHNIALNGLILKPTRDSGITPSSGTDTLIEGTQNANSYGPPTDGDLPSALIDAFTLTESDKIVGFGLNLN